ncbi:MAG TPA: protein kinase [Candidatus Acidoferrales bacterium]|nr:protein kinase [Candidatus Acidoferrales bacterium]
MSEWVLPANQLVSHYRILEKVGEGGMGVVYRAHDDRLGRDVALKFLPPPLVADKAARDLLIREARAASALNHPNICTVYDIGRADGRDYIVMEFVKGSPLASKIREGGLPDETVIAYGEQIADALAHAHEHGIIHRDLKSSNIMITPDGRAKVLDFGLAKRSGVDRPPDQTTESFDTDDTPGAGTMHYTAPEILRGGRADARSDIWSLGVMLYEMVSGRRPFQGRTAYELSSDIMYHAPPSISPKNTPGLRPLIECCMAKSPVDRYPHAGEVRAALSLLRATTPLPQHPPTPALATPAVSGPRRSWVFVIGALCVVLLALGGWAWFRERGETVAPATIHSLAVLPLENVSGDPSEEFFAEGMTDELTTQLAEISSLRVISRTSVMQYKDSKKSLPEIAKNLRVDAVVEGSVLRSGNRVRITAQLIQAETDKHLWARSYEGDARDVLGLQRNVAQEIANEVKVRLTPEEQKRLSSAPTVNPAAHEAYLKGVYLNKGTGEQKRRAKDYFEQAIRLDPNYAPAYAGLSSFYWTTLDLPPRQAIPKAKENALKALDLDPSLAQAHSELAAIRFEGDWDWPGAEQEFHRALELNPNNAESHRLYSLMLSALGRADQASFQIQRAEDLDPLSTSTQVTAGFLLYYARRYDAAIDQCRQVLELDANSPGAYDCLGSAYLAKGMYEDAVAAAQKATSLSGNDSHRLVGLGRAYALADRRTDAEKVLDQIRKRSNESYMPPYFSAVIYAALGERDAAFSWLEKAYSERDGYLIWIKVDSEVDPLRADPRFQKLLQKMNLQ